MYEIKDLIYSSLFGHQGYEFHVPKIEAVLYSLKSKPVSHVSAGEYQPLFLYIRSNYGPICYPCCVVIEPFQSI